MDGDKAVNVYFADEYKRKSWLYIAKKTSRTSHRTWKCTTAKDKKRGPFVHDELEGWQRQYAVAAIIPFLESTSPAPVLHAFEAKMVLLFIEITKSCLWKV